MAGIRGVEYLLSLAEPESRSPRLPALVDPASSAPVVEEAEDGESLFDVSCDSLSALTTRIMTRTMTAQASSDPPPSSSPYAVADLLGPTTLRNLQLTTTTTTTATASPQNLYHEFEQQQQQQQPQLPRCGRQPRPSYVNVAAEAVNGSGSDLVSASTDDESSPMSGEQIAVGEDGAPYLKSSLC